MKLIKNEYTIHALIPNIFYLSFCGLVSSFNWYIPSDSYEGSGDTVTCKTCKKLMQKYILRKLKNETV